MTFSPPTPSPTTPKPKRLTLAAIGVIVVAVFGILAGLSAPLGLLMSKHHPFAGMAGAVPDMARVIALQQKMMESPVGEIAFASGILSLAASVWALRWAIQWLAEKPGARVPFRKSILALVATESINGVVNVWLQFRNLALLDGFMTALGTSPGTPPGFEAMTRTFMQVGGLVGLVIAVVFGVAKLVFLAWAHRYAGTPEVVAHFDREA